MMQKWNCGRFGDALRVKLAASALAVGVIAATISGCGSADAEQPQAAAQQTPRTFEIALKPDVPEGYVDRVGKYEKPLRQDVTTMRLARRDDGTFNIEFAPQTKVPAIDKIDFRHFMPRVPRLAEGN